ncbi:MAG: D-aminoacylase, partial [Thermoanaerobaculia bacterium]
MRFLKLAGGLALLAALAAEAAPAPPNEPDSVSWVIVGARVADGTGAPMEKKDVRVAGDRILEVGTLQPRPGEKVVSGSGLVLAPGFIDVHNHSEEGLAT